MGQTTWLPYNEHAEKREWLLADGTVVKEPRLEQSGAGVKVRVPGTDLDEYKRNVDTLVMRAINRIAEGLGTEVWMPISGIDSKLNSAMGFEPHATTAALHALDKNIKAQTRVWFRFRHPSLPIEAMLVVAAGRNTTYSAQHDVSGSLYTTQTHPRQTLRATIAKERAGSFNGLTNGLSTSQQATFRDWLADNQPSWAPATFFGAKTFTVERHMVEEVLRLVRHADDLEAIEVPDLRDPDSPAWMTLEFVDSNLNGDFLSDLQEYMEGEPSVQRAAELYSELKDCLRTLGVVFGDAKEDDFSRALLAGTLTVDCGTIHSEDSDGDVSHSLSMDLMSGTFVVNCSLRIRAGDTAYAWQEAKAIASMTGEESELLAFARETARREGEKRAKKIITHRRKSLN